MKLTIELDAIEIWQLHALTDNQFRTVEEAVLELLHRALEGLHRPGSWEAGWLYQVFPHVVPMDFPDSVAGAEAWERQTSAATADFPAGWIGRVVDGQRQILYDAPPQATREAALALAQAWLQAHPDYTPVEEALANERLVARLLAETTP